MARQHYSRAHYERVSPRASTPDEIRERVARRAACRAAVLDRESFGPSIEADPLAAMRDQEARYRDFYTFLMGL